MQCLSAQCCEERAENSRFCAYHRDLFHRIAEEIQEGKVERIRHYRRRRRTLFKACEVDGCPNCAAPRESYCLAHLRTLERAEKRSAG